MRLRDKAVHEPEEGCDGPWRTLPEDVSRNASRATKSTLNAISASTKSGEMRTRSSTASASVSECASVNAVIVISSRRSRLEIKSSPTRNAR